MSVERKRAPVAVMVREIPGVGKLWRIKWPSNMRAGGKTYFATTYPNSERVFMETFAKRRPVSEIQGRKLLPQIKAAIAKAQAKP